LRFRLHYKGAHAGSVKNGEVIMKFMQLLLVLAFTIFATAAYGITPAKERDIEKLLDLMGNASIAEELANGLVTMAISQEKDRYPDMPKDVEHAISDVIYNVVHENSRYLDSKIIPIYDKYYTHEDIKNLIQFFKTQTGKKYASVLSPMAQEFIPIAQEWGRKIGPIAAERVAEKLNDLGYE
tara:strand:- start:187 stop:732 length:546 start_codon:yes stop_codon:yes gene_type:complete